MTDRVLLFSGGLDSLCLWYLTGRPPAVYVRIGHAYQDAELFAIGRLTHAIPDLDVQVVDGPRIGVLEEFDGHIPHRNAALLVAAAAYTGAEEILLGALLGEASPDKSRRFLRYTSRCLSASEARRIRCVAPARRWTKAGLVQRFAAAYPDHVRELTLTRSCYAPIAAGPCGECPACFRRDVALWHAGLRHVRPRPPNGATMGDAWRAARRAGVMRWPGMVVNNATAVAAVAGWRRR